MTASQTTNMLFGALVADAASLGLHWLYDPDRIAQVVDGLGGSGAFAPVDETFFDGAMGYFAHRGRHSGMLTQYGEVLRLTLQSMNTQGGAFDVAAYQSAFTAHFGPGGTYQGYIDRPTRAALDNIIAEVAPTGIDDDQNPAVARLPAIFAAYQGTPDLSDKVVQAMEVTNINDIAAAYNAVFVDVLGRVTQGETVMSALSTAAQTADPAIQTDLVAALTTSESSSTDFAGDVGRACHLPTAGPVVFHILKHAVSYRDGVERNILAGGDSAGRSIMIGAVLGCAHGTASPSGIPMEWALRMHDGAAIWAECAQLVGT